SAAELVEALRPLTSIASARRLGELVRAHRHAKPRALVEIAPVTDGLPREPSPVVISSGVRPRWARYAVGPGAWASADQAAAQRRRENRPLPQSPPPPEAEPSAQPPSGAPERET